MPKELFVCYGYDHPRDYDHAGTLCCSRTDVKPLLDRSMWAIHVEPF